MNNNSLIYMVTTDASTVVNGAVIPLTTIARRRGRCINSNSNSVLLAAPGYYKITANITFTTPTPGVVTIQLKKDDVLVSGITASTTTTVADTEVRSLSISGIVRVSCCGEQSALSLLNNGVEIETSNVALDVEYLG